jgi:uncharacterized C2H2 Zn-finger protein
MPKFECCGVRFKDGRELTSHVRSQHSVAGFTVEISCCGVSFPRAKELTEHVKKTHHYEVKVST